MQFTWRLKKQGECRRFDDRHLPLFVCAHVYLSRAVFLAPEEASESQWFSDQANSTCLRVCASVFTCLSCVVTHWRLTMNKGKYSSASLLQPCVDAKKGFAASYRGGLRHAGLEMRHLPFLFSSVAFLCAIVTGQAKAATPTYFGTAATASFANLVAFYVT